MTNSSTHSDTFDSPRGSWLHWILLATLLTAINVLKPIHTDDAAYFYYAHQWAQDPSDPYGFDVFWTQWPEPAHELLAPPALPLWWSLALRLGLDQPWQWKLWLWPISLLLVWSWGQLARRFASSLATPLLYLLVLSAAVLPAYNLMLDIPALAIGSAALVLLIGATTSDRLVLALAAGVLFAIAIETKFTGAALLGAGVLFAFIHRRWDLALATAMVCAVLVYWWEWRIYDQYGASHLLWHIRRGDVERWPKLWLIVPLFSLVGSVMPALTWLAATACRWPRWTVVLLILAQLALAVGLLFGLDPRAFAMPGALALALLIWATYELLRADRMARQSTVADSSSQFATQALVQDHWFLAAWLVMELAAYFVLTPFPATRRVLGIALAGSLLAGAILQWRAVRPRSLGWIAAASILWGVAIAALDFREAWAQREALLSVANQSGVPADTAGRWFIGHWGWQFHAEQLGWKPVVPDQSQLQAGDLVLIADGIDGPLMGAPTGSFEDNYETVAEVVVDDPIGWRTLPIYYHGLAAIEAKRTPRVTARVLRVRKPHIPVTSMEPQTLASWALLRPGPRAANAAPALVEALRRAGDRQEIGLLAIALYKASPPALLAALASPDLPTRRGALRAMALLGPRAASLVPELRKRLEDPDEAICVAAIAALGAIGPAAEEVLPDLQRLSNDPRTPVRDNARVASQMIQGRQLGSEPNTTQEE